MPSMVVVATLLGRWVKHGSIAANSCFISGGPETRLQNETVPWFSTDPLGHCLKLCHDHCHEHSENHAIIQLNKKASGMWYIPVEICQKFHKNVRFLGRHHRWQSNWQRCFMTDTHIGLTRWHKTTTGKLCVHSKPVHVSRGYGT